MSGGSALLDRPALSLGEAARDARNASVRLAGFKRGYEAVRGRGNAAVIARARASWGLAVYERAATLVALAEVEDRERAECCGRLESAVIAGGSSGGGCPAAGRADGARALASEEARADDDLALARERREACWRAYGEIGRNSDPAATKQARDLWKDAFFAWIAVFVASEAARDEQVIAEARERRKQVMRLHGADAFPRERSRSEEIVYQSRERARREAIERGRSRYERYK
jgi:hypothetical protein